MHDAFSHVQLEDNTGDATLIQRAPHAGKVFGAELPGGVGGLGGSDAGPLTELHVFWLAGMSCDGCSVAVTGATAPSVEDLLTGRLPGVPRLVLHHPVISVEAGEEFVKNYELAAEGKLNAPYVVIYEGSIANEDLAKE